MNLTDHISKYCTYGEAIRSDTAARMGIPNIPNEEQLAAMLYVAIEIFDKIREHFNVPLTASSFFRSPNLNSSTPGASKTSQHMKGEAIDHFIVGRNADIFKWVKENVKELDFDQMIWEFGTIEEPAWVHVSKVSYRKNRNEILRAFHDQEGNIRYIPFDLF
jgi:hypothetical protein